MYRVITHNGTIIDSDTPGEYGGNSKLKIYGKLDCQNALNWLSKGHYKTHRVFFKDEKSAINLGYRPCAKCLTHRYKVWKND